MIPAGKKSFWTEDWLAVAIGLAIFFAGLIGLGRFDPFGWAVKTNVWTGATKIATPAGASWSQVPGWMALLLTFAFLGLVLAIGISRLGGRPRRFILSFTVVFFASYFCFAAGHNAFIAATPDQLKKFGISWSLNLTGEAGYIIALGLGLALGNFLPGLVELLSEAIRPELYIKIAIVLLGAGLGVKSADALGLASAVMFRGLCAIVEAYLIYWALVYFVARKFFGFSREWAAPLASGISICGVSAAIATGAAIRARPIVPIMVSSLVVIFAVVELLFLPFVAQHWLHHDPLVAGAWMGLAVKTDGAAVASGTIADSLIRAKALAMDGTVYQEGWVTLTATSVKVFIDIFIGIWSFILAVIWCSKIEKTGEKVRAREIWERFPKFVLGYALTFVVLLCVCVAYPGQLKAAKAMTGSIDTFRVLFFALTFFSIGAVSNFRKLREEGIGRLALVYVVCLFGFIVWIGLFISFVFFHGMKPPTG